MLTKELEDVEAETLLGQATETITTRHWFFSPLHCLSYASLSLNLVVLIWYTLARVSVTISRQGSYESGFTTDLGPVQPCIELTSYTFTGGITLEENGEFVTDPTGSEYVGPPSKSVDFAWGSLLNGLNVDLHNPGSDVLDGAFQWPDSGAYFTGLDVFHSLHCLNRLRQALYPEYYQVFNVSGDPSRHDHIGHCINHIRQALQCHADLTPMSWMQVQDRVILGPSPSHTCRNFDKIHEWARRHRSHLGDHAAVKNGSLFVVD